MWYRIEAKRGAIPEILLYEQIGRDPFFDDGVGAQEFIRDLRTLSDAEAISVRINSPGGDVFDGYAIYNALVAHDARIDVHIDGVAASIASVIAMAGDTITMPENSMMMLHEPRGAARGTADDMRAMAGALEKVTDSIAATYGSRASVDEATIRAMMAAETWLSADEAIEVGLADEKIAPVKMAACWAMPWDQFSYAHVPARMIPPDGSRPHRERMQSKFVDLWRTKIALDRKARYAR